MPTRAATRLTELPMDPTAPLDDDGFWAWLGSDAPRRLLEGSLACFAEHGYHATTTREIAKRVGLSPGGVYVHFASKAELLRAIVLWGHHSGLHAIERALEASAGESHEARLRGVIGALVVWHVDHQDLARVVAYEQSALAPEERARFRPFRRRFLELVEGEVVAGHESGAFAGAGPRETTRALLSLCTDIARWYRPGRGPGAQELAAVYADIATRLVTT